MKLYRVRPRDVPTPDEISKAADQCVRQYGDGFAGSGFSEGVHWTLRRLGIEPDKFEGREPNESTY